MMSNAQENTPNDVVSIAADLECSPSLGREQDLLFFLGPCVIESREHALRTAEHLVALAKKHSFSFVYKSSYDKANRTSVDSFRGLGIEEGLSILAEVRESIGVPVLTDIHSAEEATIASEVVDVVQVPAFLCRQTDVLLAAGSTGKPVMIKKGQFLHPEDMEYAVKKVVAGGSLDVLACERGTCFGYRELIVDFRSLKMMANLGCPVVYDATHSVQVMGGARGSSAGYREYIAPLARAAVAFGVDGIFLECHEDPSSAPSDSKTMMPLDQLDALIGDLKKISQLISV